MSFEQQKEVLDHTFKQLTDFCGKPPVGSVAPWWETSKSVHRARIREKETDKTV